MTMRRMLQCVLVLLVLATVGCSLWDTQPDTPKTSSSPTAANTRKRINFSGAEDRVEAALKKMKSVTGTPQPTVKQVNTDVAAALKELTLTTEKIDACACPAAIEEAHAAQGLLTSISDTIGTNTKKVSELDAEVKQNLQGDLESALKKVQEATRLAAIDPSPSPIPSPSASLSPPRSSEDTDAVSAWLLFAAKLVGGILILTLVAFGLLHLRNQSRQHLEHQLGKGAAAHASLTREAQKEILDKLSSLSSAQNDTNSRLHDVHTELRTLARLVREASSSRGTGDGRSSYSSLASSYAYSDPSPPKDEPDFPVSAGDYLGKMTRFANVVRPDFQNGILISDRDGTGELVLIRDSRQPDETQPLFVVPRHAQFQTKQDFHTYYEKYYDCSRPAAGEVWIVEPAVVEKVSGGWQLREKGVLEIR